MGKSYLPDGQGAVFKNIIRFAGNTPLDGRAVVDTFNDISGEKYKSLFTHEGVASYYVGMLVVTKDTGKVYVLKETGFEEVTPDLSTILGSKSVNTYEDAVKLATNDNIGQIIYVKTTTSYDADGEGEGEAITYDAAPYIVVGKGNLQKLAASTASGDIEGDVRDLIGRVVELEKVDHSHANADVLDGITSDKVTAWDKAQENVIEEVKLFGTALTVTDKSVDVDFDATDIKVGEDIKDGETVAYSADTKVSTVLQGIQNSISNAIKGAFDKVEAGDGITVTDVQNNKQTISVKLSTDTDNLLKLKEDGLFVAMYYDGDDVEE